MHTARPPFSLDLQIHHNLLTLLIVLAEQANNAQPILLLQAS